MTDAIHGKTNYLQLDYRLRNRCESKSASKCDGRHAARSRVVDVESPVPSPGASFSASQSLLHDQSTSAGNKDVSIVNSEMVTRNRAALSTSALQSRKVTVLHRETNTNSNNAACVSPVYQLPLRQRGVFDDLYTSEGSIGDSLADTADMDETANWKLDFAVQQTGQPLSDLATPLIRRLTTMDEVDENLEHVILARTLQKDSNRWYMFTLICIMYAFGLANIWRFPYLCHKSQGGSFLLVYVILLFLVGYPLLVLEMSLGQYTRLGPVHAMEKVSPVFKGVGFASTIIAFILASYYGVIMAWGVYYTVKCLHSTMPWSVCSNVWNTPQCLRNENLTDLSQNATETVTGNISLVHSTTEFFERRVANIFEFVSIGNVQWTDALVLVFPWIIIYFTVWKGIRQRGKYVYIITIFPYLLFVALVARSVTLPGAANGLVYFFLPRLDNLGDPVVWLHATAALLHSLCLSYGCRILLSSYQHYDSNIYKYASGIVIADMMTNIIVGVAAFATLGYMAQHVHVDIQSAVTGGPGFIFELFPVLIDTLPVPHFWATWFFVILVLLANETQFGVTETFLTSITDRYHTWIKRHLVYHEALVFLVCCLLYLIGLIYVTEGGVYIMQLCDFFVGEIALIFVAICGILAVSYGFGTQLLAEAIEDMTGTKPCVYFMLCWKFVSPVCLTVIWLWNVADHTALTYGGQATSPHNEYPLWAERVGWALVLLPTIFIPGCAIVYCIHTRWHHKTAPETPVPNRHWPLGQVKSHVHLPRNLSGIEEPAATGVCPGADVPPPYDTLKDIKRKLSISKETVGHVVRQENIRIPLSGGRGSPVGDEVVLTVVEVLSPGESDESRRHSVSVERKLSSKSSLKRSLSDTLVGKMWSKIAPDSDKASARVSSSATGTVAKRQRSTSESAAPHVEFYHLNDRPGPSYHEATAHHDYKPEDLPNVVELKTRMRAIDESNVVANDESDRSSDSSRFSIPECDDLVINETTC